MISRRKFIAFLSALPLYFGCRNEEQETVAREVNLGPVRNFLEPVTPLPLYRVLVRNEGTKIAPKLRVLSLICTHQHCALSVRSELSQLHCPCHGARFDYEGNVLQGPAVEPLREHLSRIENDSLIVDLGA